MKRILLIMVVSIMSGSIALAQATNTFANKENVVSVGVGFGGAYGFDHYDAQSPVIGAQYERGILELGMGGVIGVGGFIGYKTYSYDYNIFGQSYKDKYSVIIIGARGNFHYDLFKVEKLDTYAGTQIAYHIVNEDLESSGEISNKSDDVGFSLYAGARYYFADHIAGFAEAGYGVSFLTMGIAFKF